MRKNYYNSHIQQMNQEREDSDFEVCLTSHQYTRILSIEKESKKEKEEFRLAKQEHLREKESWKKELEIYETTFKAKNQEIDQLTVECLRLKKLRILNEDEIRNFKEQHLKMRESSLAQLEESVRENKQIKEKRALDENVILDLNNEINRLKAQNISITEKLVNKSKEIDSINIKLKERIETLNLQIASSLKIQQRLEFQLTKSKVQIDALHKKSAQFKMNIKTMQKKNNSLQEQLKQNFAVQDKLKRTYQYEIKKRQNMLDEIIQKNQKQHQQQIKILKQVQNESESKINDLTQKLLSLEESKSVDQKFSSKIYQTLQKMKGAIIKPQQLHDQIEGILTLEKQYEDIIHSDAMKIKDLEEQISRLHNKNTKLLQTHQKTKRKLTQSSNIVRDLSELRVGKDENNLESENMVLKQEAQKLRLKLNRVTAEFDESVKTFNYTISDMQLKNQKELAGYTEIKNEIEAIKLSHEDLLNEISLGIERFGLKLENSKNQKQYSEPAKIKALLKSCLPNFNH